MITGPRENRDDPERDKAEWGLVPQQLGRSLDAPYKSSLTKSSLGAGRGYFRILSWTCTKYMYVCSSTSVLYLSYDTLRLLGAGVSDPCADQSSYATLIPFKREFLTLGRMFMASCSRQRRFVRLDQCRIIESSASSWNSAENVRRWIMAGWLNRIGF